jgi:hypothetical protein
MLNRALPAANAPRTNGAGVRSPLPRRRRSQEPYDV